MTPKTRKIFLATVLAVIAIAAIAACLVWNKPHKNVKDATAVKTTAVELYDRFIRDSAGAGVQYSAKVVLVTGEISQVSQNQQNQQVILLKTSLSGAFINCTMEEKVAGCKAGESVSIKGICSGYIPGDADLGLPGDVFLTRGYLFNEK